MTIAAIRQFLKHPDCIIFVGSGISMWSGIPSWSGLLMELADFLDKEGQSSELVRREMRNGDLLQAASFGISKLTLTSFGTFIRGAVRLGSASPHIIHKSIVELGPTGFITTNYDTLIEQSLRTWRSDAFFPAPVTNKHLVELADTVRARSSHFIFKPHGDINDVSSVILTREQYRTLLPGGERQNALETLKMLLMTRPVIYIGFGLRDPDFIYLRDLLLNIYQGAVRDHWAIMPDTNDEEANYWRSQYGIKLLGYKTYEQADGSRDHRDLLTLLQALATSPIAAALPPVEADVPSEAARVLALTRYTSGLIRRLTPTTKPIMVRISETKKGSGFATKRGLYENWTTTRFLAEGPHPAYLTGLPGSGKSFALRLATMKLATKLQRACMDDTLSETQLTLPILLDLKLYQGDLRSQMAAELPAGFTIDRIRGDLKLKLFLDAFNEMPSKYIKNKNLFKSLDEMQTEISNFSYAITSRTSDGLPDQIGELGFYEIDRFEQRHVDTVLSDHGITPSGRFADDIRYLLSRPFFLHLIAKGLVEVPANATPRDLFASFTQKLQLAFGDRFKTDLSLLPIFAQIAYRAIEAESEAFPLAWLSDLIALQLPDAAAFSVADVVNWLIAREVLIPYTGRRASFIHQSITEYCAAIELARRLRTDTLSLRDTFAFKKWDQCLFLSLAMMEPATAEMVLSEAIEADLAFAVSAVRYAEEGQSATVTRLLEELFHRAKDADPQRFFRVWLRHLPVGTEHVDLLRKLLVVGDSLAGQVVKLIAQVLGPHCKEELLDLLEAHAGDFNFSVNGIAPALAPFIAESDLDRLISIAEIWTQKDSESTSAISDLMAMFDSKALLRAVQPATGKVSPEMAALLAGGLSNRRDKESFELLAELLIAHSSETTAKFSLAMRRYQDKNDITIFNCLNHRHIEAIWSTRSDDNLWYSGLSQICRIRPDLKINVEKMADAHNGIESIALRYCSGVDDEVLLTLLESLLASSDTTLKHQPFEIFPLIELNWQGREVLFVRSLARDLPKLRRALTRSLYDLSNLAQGCVDLETMRPAIELINFLPASDEEQWFQFRLGKIAGYLGDAQVRAFCLDTLVHGSPRLRNWVKGYYLSSADSLTSDTLDDDMIAVLLADLNVPDRISEHWYNPLGHIATDRFVQERLLPLAEGASKEFIENLRIVIKTAGDRNRRRYLISKQ